MPADGDELRFKALLRRQVVERCIYGVDIDPLAVELCRLALWIETMDRTLPFSFLDHKIKAGNSLIGAWFDTYQHYPAMAWKKRDALKRSKEIKTFVKSALTPDLRDLLSGRLAMFNGPDEDPLTVHADARAALTRIHELPEHESAERARLYRELRASAPYLALKEAMDLWCACWFWPVDQLEHAPLPTTIGDSSEATATIVEEVWVRKQFFHWELEFPDVFGPKRSGFDAVLGNPPWETLQPISKEFFSNIDPMYRSYGKQEALTHQASYFVDQEIEKKWLLYCQEFNDDGNWVKYVSSPFGDPTEASGPEDRFPLGVGGDDLHTRWRLARNQSTGFTGAKHPFRHQGRGKPYTYKLFTELALALVVDGGRCGLIVPSGIYSDYGSAELRMLLLERCSWEWLFGFENRDKVFDIDSRFKFNPVVVVKGGKTESIRTAFMRRKLEDWEQAEAFVTPYTRAQVEQFSPKSKAILEIQSARDLQVLGKIYANSVLLGDDSTDGWQVKYSQGDWRPIADLWPELGVDPSRVMPIDAECERRMVEPDVQRTHWRVRCAQPPYDSLPIPRADIPVGIILSREGDAWIRRWKIEDIALPLYQGVMVQAFDLAAKEWISGTGLNAKWNAIDWNRKRVSPQFLVGQANVGAVQHRVRVGFRDIARTTDSRTMIAAPIPGFPAGNKVPLLAGERAKTMALAGILNSWVFDWALRARQGSASINYYILEEMPLPKLAEPAFLDCLWALVRRLSMSMPVCAPARMGGSQDVESVSAYVLALTSSERLRLRCIADAVAAAWFGLDGDDIRHVLAQTDLAPGDLRGADAAGDLAPKGFWRVEAETEPELRHTVLTVVALSDLRRMIRDCRQVSTALSQFVGTTGADGWQLPGTLRLEAYGLGRDDRATQPQVVAERLGPRFYDWQHGQSVEESWRECELHARNIGSQTPASTSASAPSPAPATGKAHPKASSFLTPDGDE